jgi:hypothetical protein
MKPGHFLSVVKRKSNKCPHGWPPHFEPQIKRVGQVYADGSTPSEQSTASRERGLEQGRGYAIGNIVLPGTPTNSAPKEWLRKIVEGTK